MEFYAFLFFLPVAGHFLSSRVSQKVETTTWILLLVFWTVIIGLRHDLGCDWDTYALIYRETIKHFQDPTDLFTKLSSFSTYQVISGIKIWLTARSNDPGYQLLMAISAYLGLGIYGVNYLCGLILILSLYIFCRSTPSPWLAWIVSTPYFLIVVAMGYSRQAVAIGLFMLGLKYLQQRSVITYLILIFLAMTFHKSAIFFTLLPLVYIGRPTVRMTIMIGIPVALAILIAFLLSIYHYHSYLEGMWYSKGAHARAWMNAVPAALLLLTSKHLELDEDRKKIWTVLAYASILAVIFVSFATTPIDRISLYLMPIQIFFWSRFPNIWSNYRYKSVTTGLIILLYGSTLFVWFTWSINSRCWVPYKNILLLPT